MSVFLLAAVLICGCSGQGKEPALSEPASQPAKVLVVCFSATGNTRGSAGKIAVAVQSDLFEIVPEFPYSAADLDWNTDCRANREQNNAAARPAVSKLPENLEDYDVIYLGYPIWWGKLPKILYTFLEQAGMEGKTVIPFCTSGSSSIDESVREIKSLIPNARVLDGRRFEAGTDEETVREWTGSFNTGMEKREGNMVKIECGGKQLSFQPADNASAAALVQKLQQGSLTVSVDDYGDFEKVGSLGFSLPESNEQISTVPGDVILYQGNQITLYYDQNQWNFTRLGTIPGMSRESMLDFLQGSGPVQVTFSLE